MFPIHASCWIGASPNAPQLAEAVETVIAGDGGKPERLIAESGDLLYHLLIVLHARGISLAEIEAALSERQGMSGLEEKSTRPRE